MKAILAVVPAVLGSPEPVLDQFSRSPHISCWVFKNPSLTSKIKLTFLEINFFFRYHSYSLPLPSLAFWVLKGLKA